MPGKAANDWDGPSRQREKRPMYGSCSEMDSAKATSPGGWISAAHPCAVFWQLGKCSCGSEEESSALSDQGHATGHSSAHLAAYPGLGRYHPGTTPPRSANHHELGGLSSA